MNEHSDRDQSEAPPIGTPCGNRLDGHACTRPAGHVSACSDGRATWWTEMPGWARALQMPAQLEVIVANAGLPSEVRVAVPTESFGLPEVTRVDLSGWEEAYQTGLAHDRDLSVGEVLRRIRESVFPGSSSVADAVVPETPVHACPPGDGALTPCCGRSPFELLAHRITIDPALVTCRPKWADLWGSLATVDAGASPSTPEPSGAVTEAHSGEERVRKYAEAIMGPPTYELNKPPVDLDSVARAVMAVADAEQAELRRQVNRWHLRAQAAEALEQAHRERAEAAEAKVARVEAVTDGWEGVAGDLRRRRSCRHDYADQIETLTHHVEDVRAALAGPAEPDTTEGGE